MRLFIAIDIPEEIKLNLNGELSTLKYIDKKNVKWIDCHSMHITLKFIGELPDNRVPDLIQSINRISVPALPLTIKNFGAFPTFQRAKVYWTGVYTENPDDKKKLYELIKNLDEKIHELGIAKEKHPFNAHLTLGRVKFPPEKKITEYLKKAEHQKNFGSFTMTEIILFKSVLKSTGAEYSVVERFKSSNL